MADAYGIAPYLTWRGRSWPALLKLQKETKCPFLIQGSQHLDMTWRFPPSLPCNDTKGEDNTITHTCGWIFGKCPIHCVILKGLGNYWAWISVLILSCVWWWGEWKWQWVSQGHPWFLLYWNLILYRGYIYLFIYIYIFIFLAADVPSEKDLNKVLQLLEPQISFLEDLTKMGGAMRSVLTQVLTNQQNYKDLTSGE